MSPKLRLFVEGRKETLKKLNTIDFENENWLWFHCASLGEYEQAVPLIEKMKDSQYKILVSFFSPSGYEQKKNHKLIDVAIYLYVDTRKNAQKLIEKINPKKAFFIKYELWENYFYELEKRGIPIYLVSSAFRGNQVYFQWYGKFFKNTLQRVTHFFVQNESSKQVLRDNGFDNVTLSGDTRFDRVHAQLQMDNQLDFVEEFKQNRLCIVLGSTWPECEEVFVEAINASSDAVCFIIAPHEIKQEKINTLKSKITVGSSIYSEGIKNQDKVLIVDAVGFLTRIYSYADIAYVGGAIGTTGLHNILEPAVFGMPIVVGPNVDKFPEAKALQEFGGLRIVNSATEFQNSLDQLIKDSEYRNLMSKASENFIKEQVGATERVISFLNKT